MGQRTSNLLLAALASVTLGLAPFSPEPHLVGKLRWVFGGGNGMGAVDVFDLAMHGAPWVWLLWSLSAFAPIPGIGSRPIRARWARAALVASVGLALLCVVWAWL